MVAKGYRAAARAGFAVEFWELTPYETGLRFSAHGEQLKEAMERDVVRAWYGVALARTKKLPKLEDLLKADKPRNLSAELKAAFLSLPKENRDELQDR